jgi:hypothetical protein
MNQFLVCLTFMIALSVAAQPAAVTFKSGTEQVSLLELYTSEGCSSCPPAETWLSGLKESPGLWKDFVPLAFHVDYWDYLGWRDPWGSRPFSDRQRAYAKQWHNDSIYTPGFVRDGKEWRGWRGRKDGPGSTGVKAGMLTVSSSGTNHWQVSFIPAHTSGRSYEVHAALLASGLSSDVKAGENRGRRLRHDFVVLKLVTASLVQSGEQFQGGFILSQPSNAVANNLALTVWITPVGGLESLQATGGWLAPPLAGKSTRSSP